MIDTVRQAGYNKTDRNPPVLAISAKGARPVMIRSIQEAARQMASLSIYKGILDRTVPHAFYRLLKAGSKCAASQKEKHKRTFLEWLGGLFCSALSAGIQRKFCQMPDANSFV